MPSTRYTSSLIYRYRHIDSFFMAPDILAALGVIGFITYYIFIIAFVMGFLLLGLNCHHGRMIGRGETSVEHLLNQHYNNQSYELGSNVAQTSDISRIQHWKRFLGIRNIREFIRRVLLPSTHKPRGNGVTMDDYGSNTNLIVQRKNSDRSKQQSSYVSNSSYNSTDGHFASKYRSSFSYWPRESISNSFNSYYKPRTSSADWKIMLN